MTPRLKRTATAPKGQVLAEGEGEFAGIPHTVSLTCEQLHVRVNGGLSYAVDLPALIEGALAAIARDIMKREREAWQVEDEEDPEP